jgi:hypothetical protein
VSVAADLQVPVNCCHAIYSQTVELTGRSEFHGTCHTDRGSMQLKCMVGLKRTHADVEYPRDRSK